MIHLWKYVTMICDQICQKRSYTLTVSRHTFHRHLLVTSMHQQHMCLILLKVERSPFTQAFFSSLSGIHECLDGFWMVPSSLGKQKADWITTRLADGFGHGFSCFVTCGGENITNGGHFHVFSEDIAFACYFMAPRPPPTLPPYRNASGID